jgi:hypothetical protein
MYTIVGHAQVAVHEMGEVGLGWYFEAERRRKDLSKMDILYAERKRVFLHIVLKQIRR